MGTDGKLTKEAIGYILCNCLMGIVGLFVSTFLVAYLLTISNGNMFNVALYYIMNYIGLGLFYTIFSCFLHKYNKVNFYRASILFECLFLVLISLLKENIIDYVIPIALFYGLISGLRWSSYNLLINEAISSKSIQKFYGIYNICGYVISIVAPITLGSIIDAGSFIKTSIYAFIAGLFLFFATFLLVSRKEEGDKLNFKGFFKEVRESKQTKAFLESYLMLFVNGLRTSLGTLITIMIVMTFNSNVSLGSLSSIMSMVSIFVTFVFMKKYNSKQSKVMFLCLLLFSIGLSGLLFDINKTTIIIFNVLCTISMLVPDNLNAQRRMGIVRVTKKLKYALEHNIIAEITLNIGRVISYSVLLIASFSNSMNIYKILLIVNLVIVCVYCFVIHKVEKKYSGIIFRNDLIKHLKEVENDCERYYHYKGEIKEDTFNRELIKSIN